MDLKRLFLLTIRKWWIVVLAALTGALIGCACYLIVHVVYAPAREYEAMSKLYIDFEIASTGEAYQYYNGYTWNDLMKTDPILDVTMEELPTAYERDMVQDSVTAEILSDIRLLTITVRTSDPVQTAEILTATQKSLVQFAQNKRELEQIEVYQTTEPTLVVFDLKTGRVAAVWALLTGGAAILLVLLWYAMDDALYLPTDVMERYELPILGIRGYRDSDIECNLNYRYKEKEIEILDWKSCQSLDETAFARLRGKDAVVLELPCGKKIGKTVRYLLDLFALQNCPVDAVILTDSNEKLLKQYYTGEQADRAVHG